MVIFECGLWFNSGKEEKRLQLELEEKNSGVGINILAQHRHHFNSKIEFVDLQFDDGTRGRAKVKKDSWGNCTHLINISIGAWSRANGLWKQKLTHSQVPVYLEIIEPYNVFRVLTQG